MSNGPRNGDHALGGADGVADVAERALVEAGFAVTERNRNVPGLGVAVSVVAHDRHGEEWYVDVTGGFTVIPAGLVRLDTLWKCLGRASVLAANGMSPLLLLTSQLPPARSAGGRALRMAGPRDFFDVVDLADDDGRRRLREYARGGRRAHPLAGFWTDADVAPA